MAASSSVKKLIDTAYIIEAKDTHRHSIIWFHGFGDSSDGYKDLFTQIQVPNTRVILPNAPKRWVTIEGRQYHIQSWYERDEKNPEQDLQVLESIKELIDDELKLVDNASHIIIGGFRYL
jgi:phospholipase/carboxylesterase